MTTPEETQLRELIGLPEKTSPPGQADTSTEGEQDSAETIDWEARFKDSETKNEKLENDLKSASGRARKDDTAHSIAALAEKMDGHYESNLKLIRGLSGQVESGDASGMATTIDQVEQTRQGRQQTSSFMNVHDALRDTMQELVDDAPEEANRWDEEVRKQNELKPANRSLTELYKISFDAVKASAKKRNETLETENADLKKAAEGIRKSVEDEYDVHNVDGASGSMTGAEGATTMGALVSVDKRTMGQKDLAEAKKNWDRLMPAEVERTT